jgi:hypothetical protein
MSDRVTIVFRVDDEIGGIGIAGQYRLGMIIGIYRTHFPVSTKMAISGVFPRFGALVETGANRHCMARF